MWPPPPDRARISYVGALVSDRDVEAPKSLGQRVEEAVFGEEPAQGMVSPVGVCVGEDGRVFVADPGLRCVHVFGIETRDYETWRPPPAEEGGVPMTNPIALALDPSGRLLVTDSAEGTVLIFDADGGFVGTIGDNLLARPAGIAVDPADGRIFVVDTGGHEVVVLAPDGEEIARFGGRGGGPGQLNYPTHVALDGEGNVWVSDSLNFRVQAFGPGYEPLRSVGEKGDMPGYFAQPKGVGVHPAGHLYVVDAHFEAVQIFDLEGRLLMTFGREGRGPGEFWLPSGLHIDGEGRVWIADSYNQRVQVFTYLGGEPEVQR